MARVVITEYPKSGGNWIVGMLGDALQLPKRDIYDVVNDRKAFDLSRHPWYQGASKLDLPESCVIKSHELPSSPLLSFPASFVHLVRDGRDVVVSKYFYEKEFCVRNHIYERFDVPFDDYVPAVALAWSTYVLSWLEAGPLTCRYEDFLRDPFSALRDLLERLEVAVPDSQIRSAVEANSKEKMKLALDRTFRHNTFVRKGVQGDWRNYFNDDHVLLFKQAAGDALIKLAYEKDPDWTPRKTIDEKETGPTGLGSNSEKIPRYSMEGNGLPQIEAGRAPQCWCGNRDLKVFSPGYLNCAVCRSLVLEHQPTAGSILHSTDADADLYGKDYYLKHLPEKYGYPDFKTRARADLPERCLYWLRTLLKYKLPPAKVLELGSAHGGFVAMLRWTGFQATGLELSPWLVDFAKKTFSIPMLLGPLEEQTIEAGSLDAVVLMDVLEHLPDPLGTMRCCLTLLKPDGIIMIQTPSFPEQKSYKEMMDEADSFLQHLKESEHLYLFSKRSICELFRRLGAEYMMFEQAIFAHYDMFLAVSKTPLVTALPEEIEDALVSTPGSRLILALCDLDDRSRELQKRYGECEGDRTARLEAVAKLGAQLQESESDRAARLTQINQLSELLNVSEADRAARLEVIDNLEAKLKREISLREKFEKKWWRRDR